MQELDDVLARAVRRRAAVVLGLRLPDGTTHVVGRTRDHDEAPPDGRSLFEIGSITKTFTALLLADGVVRGDWRLDTPVADLLPGVRVPRGDGAEVTLEHLARHTSGLPHSPIPVVRGTWRVWRGRDPYAAVTEERLLERVASARLRHPPGAGSMRYSNLGAALLGLAMTRTTRTSYGALVEQRIGRPLGLVDTTTHDRLTAEQRSRLVPGTRGRREVDPWLLDGLPGAGALRSTTTDLGRYLEAQLDPDSTPLGEAIRLTHLAREGEGPTVGLGWMRFDQPDHLWWHNGGTGGYRSFAGFLPAEKVSVVVLTSGTHGVDLLALRRLRVAADTRAQ